MYELENTEKMLLRFLPSFLFRYVTLDFNLPHWGGSVLARYVSVVHGIWISSHDPAESVLVDCSPSSIFS